MYDPFNPGISVGDLTDMGSIILSIQPGKHVGEKVVIHMRLTDTHEPYVVHYWFVERQEFLSGGYHMSLGGAVADAQERVPAGVFV